MSTAIVKCNCHSTPACDFQDRRYGKGRRVANINGKGDGSCTCCGAMHRGLEKEARKKTSSSGGRGGAKWFIAVPPPEGWKGGLPEHNGYRKIT